MCFHLKSIPWAQSFWNVAKLCFYKEFLQISVLFVSFPCIFAIIPWIPHCILVYCSLHSVLHKDEKGRVKWMTTPWFELNYWNHSSLIYLKILGELKDMFTWMCLLNIAFSITLMHFINIWIQDSNIFHM